MSATTVEVLLASAGVVAGVLFGLLLASEARLFRRTRSRTPTPSLYLDLSVPAARGELDAFLDWDWPACATPRDEQATPRSLRR